MAKDPGYHRDAVQYNKEAAEFFADLASRLTDPIVKKWPAGIAKQHEYHQIRHERALAKAEAAEQQVPEDLTAGYITDDGVVAGVGTFVQTDAKSVIFSSPSPIEIPTVDLVRDAAVEEIETMFPAYCPEEAFHQPDSGYFDAQGHHITEARYIELTAQNSTEDNA